MLFYGQHNHSNSYLFKIGKIQLIGKTKDFITYKRCDIVKYRERQQVGNNINGVKFQSLLDNFTLSNDGRCCPKGRNPGSSPAPFPFF